jgi:isopentenyldiphosphate isomerase
MLTCPDEFAIVLGMDKQPYQLCDEQGNPLVGQGAHSDVVLGEGLLHGAAHVWIWRSVEPGRAEVLLQQRAADKWTWPDCYDISAAGHVDLGEEPLTAAVREVHEELGLQLQASQLLPMGTVRAHLVAPNGAIENEVQWLYTFELTGEQALHLQQSEVASVKWLSLTVFQSDTSQETLAYVPHGSHYYRRVIDELQRQLAGNE